jgi:putative transposase
METIVGDKTGQGQKKSKESMLDYLARQGALKMLTEALDEEVTAFLDRRRYERAKTEAKGYRNGRRTRQVAVLGAGLELSVPRVAGVEYRSNILTPYQRRSPGVDELFRRLYLEGLSSRDFEPALRSLVGESSTLSASSIQRLALQFQRDFEAFGRRDLSRKRYAYVWADGVYLKAGLESEKAAILVLVGVNENGRKELISVMEGYRESYESWREIWRGVKERRLISPLLVIGDGIAGLWKAIEEVYPTAKSQRCWKHKMMNVLDKVPSLKQEEVLDRLRAAYQTDTREKAEQHLAVLAEELQNRYPRAAQCIREDQEALLRYFDYPPAHWIHLKTTNPIESIFASVRLRTYVLKRFQKAHAAAAFVFKIIERLSQNWQRIDRPELVARLWAEQSKGKKIKMAMAA